MQVQGIDESDLVKNDGTHIYSVGGSHAGHRARHPPEAKAVLSHTELLNPGSRQKPSQHTACTSSRVSVGGIMNSRFPFNYRFPFPHYLERVAVQNASPILHFLICE